MILFKTYNMLNTPPHIITILTVNAQAKDFNADAATKKSACLQHDIKGWFCNIET